MRIAATEANLFRKLLAHSSQSHGSEQVFKPRFRRPDRVRVDCHRQFARVPVLYHLPILIRIRTASPEPTGERAHHHKLYTCGSMGFILGLGHPRDNADAAAVLRLGHCVNQGDQSNGALESFSIPIYQTNHPDEKYTVSKAAPSASAGLRMALSQAPILDNHQIQDPAELSKAPL